MVTNERQRPYLPFDKGVAVDSGKCPVALAMIAAGVDNPNVTSTFALSQYRCSSGLFEHSFADNPEEVKTFVDEYDRDHLVKPFEFDITFDYVTEEE